MELSKKEIGLDFCDLFLSIHDRFLEITASWTFTNKSFTHLTWDWHHIPTHRLFGFFFWNVFSFLSSLAWGPEHFSQFL